MLVAEPWLPYGLRYRIAPARLATLFSMPAPLFMSSWSAVRQQGRVRWWFVSLVLLAAAAAGAWWWKQQAPAAASAGAARTPGRTVGFSPVAAGVLRLPDGVGRARRWVDPSQEDTMTTPAVNRPERVPVWRALAHRQS